MPKAIEVSVAERQAEPFRFLDLPAELRNEIYKLLLCTMDDPLVPLSDQIYSQILRTCQRVYHEAMYVMRRNNLFVEVICSVGFAQWPLEWFNIPFVVLEEHQRQNFKGIVMSHELFSGIEYRVRPYPSNSFLIHRRHLDRLCTALRYLEATQGYMDSRWKHKITLRDHYETYSGKHNLLQKPFLSLKRQRELLEPYQRLGALDEFVVNGNVDYCLGLRVEQAVRSRHHINPEEVRDLMQSFKEETTKALNCPELAEPFAISSRVIRKTWIILKGTKWDYNWDSDTDDEGPVATEDAKNTEKTVFDQIVRLHFEIWLDLFKITIANWQRDKRLPCTRSIDVIDKALDLFVGYGGSEWRISSKQFAELYHQKAIAWRLVGEMAVAHRMISRALSARPRAPELLKEKSTIALLSQRKKYRQPPQLVWSCMRWLLLFLTVGTITSLVLLPLFEITLCFQTTPAMTICFPSYSLADDIILWTKSGNRSLVLT